MLEALDQYHADTGAWPQSLQELADRHYLRAVPKAPFTDRQHTCGRVPPAGQDSYRGWRFVAPTTPSPGGPPSAKTAAPPNTSSAATQPIDNEE